MLVEGILADVFISYSKQHPKPTEDLVADLREMGISVWWDTELLPAESFRDKILAELNSAKAAIVIWTPASVSSDWVYSEASRAKAAGKLIQVRVREVDPRQVPPPFDALHLPIIDDRKGIVAALTKLGVIEGSSGSPAAALPRAVKLQTGTSAASARPVVLISIVGAVLAAAIGLFGLWRVYDAQKTAVNEKSALELRLKSEAEARRKAESASEAERKSKADQSAQESDPKKRADEIESARNKYLAEMREAQKNLPTEAAVAVPQSAKEVEVAKAVESWVPNEDCRQMQNGWGDKKPARSIAVASNGHCMMTSGYKTVADAEANALKSCSERFGGECKTIKSYGGDWTAQSSCSEWQTSAPVRVLAVAQNGWCSWVSAYNGIAEAKAAALNGCEKGGEKCRVAEIFEGDWSLQTECQGLYSKWRSMRGRGSFAAAQNGKCGYSYGFGNTGDAQTRAMNECSQNGYYCKIIANK